MTYRTPDKNEVATFEQLRLMIAIAVIATTVGIFTLDSNEHSLAGVLRGFAILPSLLLGMYTLFTAAHLKYKGQAELGALSIPERLRQKCYDIGVDLFWTMFMVFAIIFIATLFGWDGDIKKLLVFWPSFIVSFVVLGIFVVITALTFEKEQRVGGADKKALRFKMLWRKK